jgi:hypothetical protein
LILKSLTGTAELSFKLLEYEKNDPEKGDYLHLRVDAKSNGFMGWSEFWLEKASLQHFLCELEEFDAKLTGNPILQCGVGSDVYFSIELFTYDRLGHIGIHIELASPNSESEKGLHRLIAGFQIEAGQISELVKAFRYLLWEQRVQ